MLLGGLNGYAFNYFLYPSPLQSMRATPAISQDLTDTFLIWEGFDKEGQAILSYQCVSVLAIGAVIESVGTGINNILLPESNVIVRFPKISAVDQLTIEINGSVEGVYKGTYVMNLPYISGTGWLIPNVQGATQDQIMAGKIRLVE